MTASVKLDEIGTAHKLEDAPKLPGVLFLLRDTLITTWEHRVAVYGYTAWLLIPIIISVFARGIPSPYGNYLLSLGDFLSLVLGLWVTAAIMLYITVATAKEPEEGIDLSALGKRAWEKIVILFIVQVFTVCLVLFGAILLLIPGVIALVWTTFAAQEAVLSKKGVWDTFKHSRELTRGRFFPILGRLIVANIVFFLITMTSITGYIVVGLQGSASQLLPTLMAMPSWLEVGISLIILPLTPITIIFHLLLYFAVKKSYSAANV